MTQTDSIAFVTGSAITDKDHPFALTMSGLGRIQMRAPFPKDERAFLSLSRVISFCGSPVGIGVMLAEASGLQLDEVEATWTPDEQIDLSARVLAIFLGIDQQEESAKSMTEEGDGGNADPIGTAATG